MVAGWMVGGYGASLGLGAMYLHMFTTAELVCGCDDEYVYVEWERVWERECMWMGDGSHDVAVLLAGSLTACCLHRIRTS